MEAGSRVQSGAAKGAAAVLLTCLLVALDGCGYRVASQNRLPAGSQTLVVLPLENETTTFEVEQFLTRALVQAFVQKTSYQVMQDPDRADLLLKGVISRVTANPVLFGGETFGSTFVVTLSARVELRERETGRVRYRNDHYIFREQYVINSDVENFFSELNPALKRIGDDFAASVVSSVLEDF